MLIELIPNVGLRLLLVFAGLAVGILALFGGFVVTQMWKERDL